MAPAFTTLPCVGSVVNAGGNFSKKKLKKIDVSIVSDCIDNDLAYNNKVEYYNIESIRKYAREVSTADTITIGACIFDWRGRPGKLTVCILKQLGLSKDDITLLNVKTLEGGVITYNNYKKS